MNTKEIVVAHLKANGLDGLVAECRECACLVDDLMPCDDPGQGCEAGHKVDGCSDDCGQGCDWHIVTGPMPLKERVIKLLGKFPSGQTGSELFVTLMDGGHDKQFGDKLDEAIDDLEKHGRIEDGGSNRWCLT